MKKIYFAPKTVIVNVQLQQTVAAVVLYSAAAAFSFIAIHQHFGKKTKIYDAIVLGMEKMM